MNVGERKYKQGASQHRRKLIVITGGPGSGKSTLVSELVGRGYQGFEEGGRAIIRDQRLIGGRALPRLDPLLFSEILLCWHIRTFRMAEQTRADVLVDRGIPDTMGFLFSVGIAVPDHVVRAIELFRYDNPIVVAPPWKEIYETDAERQESYNEAVDVYNHMCRAYQMAGYELVELPKVPVEERALFVEATFDLN